MPKKPKKWVIHRVIHVIHIKGGGITGLHSKKRKHLFCEVVIKLIILEKNKKKHWHFNRQKIINMKRKIQSIQAFNLYLADISCFCCLYQ